MKPFAGLAMAMALTNYAVAFTNRVLASGLC